MKKTKLTLLIGVVMAMAVLYSGAGQSIAGEPVKDTKPSKESASPEAKEKRVTKVEKKKRLHEERKAAAARFKAARESGAAKAANKK